MSENTVEEMKKDFKEKKETEEDFIRAVELKKREVQRPNINTILLLKSRLGNALIVECPKCGQKQRTQSTVSRNCISCHSTFRIFPKNSPSRVAYCPENLKPTLFQLYSLENDGKFLNVL